MSTFSLHQLYLLPYSYCISLLYVAIYEAIWPWIKWYSHKYIQNYLQIFSVSTDIHTCKQSLAILYDYIHIQFTSWFNTKERAWYYLIAKLNIQKIIQNCWYWQTALAIKTLPSYSIMTYHSSGLYNFDNTFIWKRKPLPWFCLELSPFPSRIA